MELVIIIAFIGALIFGARAEKSPLRSSKRRINTIITIIFLVVMAIMVVIIGIEK